MPEYEQKTEQATPRKRQKAREKGQVARSSEIISLAATAGIIFIFYFAGNTFIRDISVLTSRLLGLGYGRDPIAVMRLASVETFKMLMPFLGLAVSLALVSGAAQGGFLVSPPTLEMETLNPIKGFKRIFSMTGLAQFLKSLFKFSLGGVLFFFLVKKMLVILPFTAAMDVIQIKEVAGNLAAKSVISAFTLFFALAAIDYLYQKWSFERSLRMSKEEIKEEHRETEGDPLVKARIKSLQKEMARRRMMQEVPKATVVITNPTHVAVALRYKKDEMPAPKVIARGAGLVAEKIKETARKHRIPIVEDKPLARALYKLKINSVIPEELYRAVAKILAYIYQLRGVA
jgi:flagellar biosynthetic protein FlhB